MAEIEEGIRQLIAETEKKYGKGSVMRMGDRASEKVEVIPTGSIGLDIALGVGGIPTGRMAEFYGEPSSGKSTLALSVCAQAQRMGELAYYIDVEHALDPHYAERMGVDMDNLLLSQPDSAEQALELTESIARSEKVKIIVLDSVAALVPEAEIEGEMGQSHVGLVPRLVSQACRKLTPVVSKTGTAVIFINQLRSNIGVMYGNPETTSGGRALRHHVSIRLKVQSIGKIKDSKDGVIGARTKVQVSKNKLAPPFHDAIFDLMYVEGSQGISRLGEVIDYGVTLHFISQNGSWFKYGDTPIGQGREKAKDFLLDHPVLLEELEERIKNHYLGDLS